MDLDLFVVNRHLDDGDETKVTTEDIEEENLERIKKRIQINRERRRKKREIQRESQILKWKIIERRLKEKHFGYVQPEVNNEFIDENINAFAKKLEDDERGITGEIQPERDPDDDDDKREKRKRFKKTEPGEEIDGFTVLGSDDFVKKQKVASVLPDWLAHPIVISTDLQNLQTKVSSAKWLSKALRNKLKEENIKYLFPVQCEIIPYLLRSYKLRYCMAPRDICVSSPTGSGKTLAFVLPIIEALQNAFVKRIRALVILPTQDLAAQVFQTFRNYAVGTKLEVLLVTGGTLFAEEQKKLVQHNVAFGYVSKVDILIGTPGRLVDHIKQTAGFTLEHLEFLVIDEADRVLDNIQHDWLYHLERHIRKDDQKDVTSLTLCNYATRKSPQKLLFSATLSQDPEKLHQLGLFQPKLFTSILEEDGVNAANISEQFVGKYTTPKELTQKYVITSLNLKPLVLYEFMKNEGLTRTLVFTNSRECVHRLKILLQSLFGREKTILEIGSRLDNYTRTNLIKRFGKGKIDFLICTDSMARGIDLPGVQCVINYDAPKYLKTYIHRAGRTARAGEQGLVMTMLIESHYSTFCNMLVEGVNKSCLEEVKIDEERLKPLAELYQTSLQQLKDTIHGENVNIKKKTYACKRVSY